MDNAFLLQLTSLMENSSGEEKLTDEERDYRYLKAKRQVIGESLVFTFSLSLTFSSSCLLAFVVLLSFYPSQPAFLLILCLKGG